LATRRPILIVEDDETALAVYSDFFERSGFGVVGVRYGERVLEYAHRHSPALILLDLTLAGPVDGLEAARQLKHDPGTAMIPIIVVTGAFSRARHATARALGCVDVVVKPFPPEQLVGIVRDYLDNDPGR
jgi:CheY-like chemotaxis protein